MPLPREQLQHIATLARTDFTQDEIRCLAGYSRLGFLQPPYRGEPHSVEVLAAVEVSGEIPERLLQQYITAYRAGWQEMPDHAALLDNLKTLYREGARARSEHDLNERTP